MAAATREPVKPRGYCVWGCGSGEFNCVADTGRHPNSHAMPGPIHQAIRDKRFERINFRIKRFEGINHRQWVAPCDPFVPPKDSDPSGTRWLGAPGQQPARPCPSHGRLHSARRQVLSRLGGCSRKAPSPPPSANSERLAQAPTSDQRTLNGARPGRQRMLSTSIVIAPTDA